MTVIAMLKGEGEVFYVGADSQFTDLSGLKTLRTKITAIDIQGNTIVWAVTGSPQIGIAEFGAWLNGYQITKAMTWASFMRAAAGEFARLNRIRKEIGGKARQDVNAPAFKRDHLCQIFICGWLNKKSAGYSVGDDGTYEGLEIHGFLTGGSGAPFAEAVFKTLDRFQEMLGYTDEQVFVELMDITSRFAGGCSLPYSIVKISQDGVQRYQSKEPEPGVEEVKPASNVVVS